jgi:hypothetical protein
MQLHAVVSSSGSPEGILRHSAESRKTLMAADPL